MNKSLSKSAKSLQNALKSNGLECRVVELASSTRTAHDAATSIGCSIGQIVKSLIFKTAVSFKPILILVSGLNRVNEKVIESYVGEKIIKAEANFVRNVTGFAIGGIPPIGHTQKIDLIFIDQDLMKLDSLWAAAGTSNTVFKLQAKDLFTLTQGKVINLTLER